MEKGRETRHVLLPNRHAIRLFQRTLPSHPTRQAELIFLNQIPSANSIIIMNSRLFLVLRALPRACRVPLLVARGRTPVTFPPRVPLAVFAFCTVTP
jgi:hypothetical protein